MSTLCGLGRTITLGILLTQRLALIHLMRCFANCGTLRKLNTIGIFNAEEMRGDELSKRRADSIGHR